MLPNTVVLGFAAALAVLPVQAFAQTQPDIAKERSDHPRIVHAIEALQDAIDYLEKAPPVFGGHKAAAVEASRRAVEELRKALAYRASEEAGPEQPPVKGQ